MTTLSLPINGLPLEDGVFMRKTLASITPDATGAVFGIEVVTFEQGTDWDVDGDGNRYVDGYYSDEKTHFTANGFENVYDAEMALFAVAPFMSFRREIRECRRQPVRIYEEVI